MELTHSNQTGGHSLAVVCLDAHIFIDGVPLMLELPLCISCLRTHLKHVLHHRLLSGKAGDAAWNPDPVVTRAVLVLQTAMWGGCSLTLVPGPLKEMIAHLTEEAIVAAVRDYYLTTVAKQ